MRLSLYWFVFSIVFCLDQFLKSVFAASLNLGVSFSLFENVNGQVLIIVIFFFFSVAAWWLWREMRSFPFWRLAHAAFVAAAFSNLLDRLLLGGVRDIWLVPFLGVRNNFADWVIVGVLLSWSIFLLWTRYTTDDGN